jgi:omega-hydroxy-beta-dihydromenaquinone-9 sulfotransferase
LTGIDGDLLTRRTLRRLATEADPYATGHSHMSPTQAFIGRWLVSNLMGLSLGDWAMLATENRFAIGPRYWSRAAVTTILSLLNSTFALAERVAFGQAIAAAQPRAPVFILGHWRSGTTLLHNLMALDHRFAAPNLFETMLPHGFLVTESWQAPLWSHFVPETRLIDNMPLGIDLPQEDEFALAILTRYSPYMGHSFPRRWAHYMRYLDFRDVEASERARWQQGVMRYARRLTVHRGGRRLVLKSPPHTARIPLLLELFPDARFIHIHRDPYRVFQSSLHVLTEGLPLAKMQSGDLPAPEDFVIDRYNRLYDAYFGARPGVPPDRLVEIGFSTLQRDPVGTMRQLYRDLDIDGFALLQPALETYCSNLGGYAQNRYPDLDLSLRQRIAKAWQRSFEAWGYDPKEADF